MSATTPRAAILGIGAHASLGLHARAIAAAVRAGLNRFQESDWLRRREDGSPITGAFLSTLDPRRTSVERMQRLAVEAANQALAPLLERGRWSAGASLPMLVSVPRIRPGLHKEAGPKLIRAIAEALPIPPDRRHSGAYGTGHEGGLAALAYAFELLGQRKAEACLVGGVESYRDIEALHWLEEQGRLKGEDTPSGLVPGEGAAFLLVCSETFAKRNRLSSLGSIASPFRAMEPNPWYERRPCTGEGLTGAVRGALDGALPESVRADVTWCDLNGEAWRSDEWAYAYLRTAERHGEPLRLRHPADCLGDLGAATSPMLVALSALDLSHPRTTAGTALVFASSDTTPYRSACVVQKPLKERA